MENDNLETLKEQLLHIETQDQENIALWKYTPQTDLGKHIFLTHGLFSNRKICSGIATYLTEIGYTCWLMEWRNHGESSLSTKKFNFETIANYDLDATLDFLFNDQKIPRLDCVLHSGGGLALTMLLIKKESYRSNIDSITLFGVQAFGAGIKIGSRFKIFVGKYLSAIVGEVPAKVVGSTEHSEGYYMMKQWFDWNLKRNFKGRDGFDYKSRMNEIRIPILSICAEGDSFIAPKSGCEKFLNAFENDQNRLIYLSEKNGNLENYNHSRILKSQNSKKEVWPLVTEWIEGKE